MPALGIIEDVRISRIRPSPYNSRTDPGRIDGLLHSIRGIGLLQPLVVRPTGEFLEIVAGNRRLEACRRLGWRKVPCHVVELSNREAFEVSLIENIQRKTLNPIEEAEAFRRYVDEYGWGGVSELARRIGKSQEYVSKRLRLLALPQEIRDELTVGRINSSVAEELLSLDDEEMRRDLGQIASSDRLTLKEIRSLTRMLKGGDGDPLRSQELPTPSLRDKDRLHADRALRRTVVILRTAMMRLDEILEDLDDGWMIRELLMEYRLSLHDGISSFIRARHRLDRLFEERAIEVLETVP